jgi:hypothetical protein
MNYEYGRMLNISALVYKLLLVCRDTEKISKDNPSSNLSNTKQMGYAFTCGVNVLKHRNVCVGRGLMCCH